VQIMSAVPAPGPPTKKWAVQTYLCICGFGPWHQLRGASPQGVNTASNHIIFRILYPRTRLSPSRFAAKPLPPEKRLQNPPNVKVILRGCPGGESRICAFKTNFASLAHHVFRFSLLEEFATYRVGRLAALVS